MNPERPDAFRALQGLGLFVRPEFLDEKSCTEMETCFLGAAVDPAGVTSDQAHGDFYVDRSFRSTDRIRLPEPFDGQIRAHLADLLAPLSDHFGVALQRFDEPQYLVYGPGDFFKAHRDNTSKTLRHRKVSVVIYLSGVAGEDPAPFSGGELVLYGLLDRPGWELRGMHVPPRRGALVAFPSDTRHQVLPVTAGRRCTIVSWAG
ncbi:MAG: 2OG-Fe(II) oxygenase [Gammaproteobacteria bacterium]|nr:2OG-Fe(II) oxygenase [Gammaproteobacteria bacterium]